MNHSIFWKNLAPIGKGGGEIANGDLLNDIKAQYGSLENLQTAMSTATVGVQGSGWGWLGFDKTNNRLAIATTGNQDPLQPTTGLIPILGIDVWEHAYYLQVKNEFTLLFAYILISCLDTDTASFFYIIKANFIRSKIICFL